MGMKHKRMAAAAHELLSALRDCVAPFECRVEHNHGDFSFLSAGYYSAVYTHPSFPGKVFKVSLRKFDSAPIVAERCMKLKRKIRGVPVVYAVFYCAESSHVCVVAQEYEGISTDYKLHSIEAILDTAGERYETSWVNPSIPEYLRVAAKALRLRGYSVDLHVDNIMYDRRRKCLVINDPYGGPTC